MQPLFFLFLNKKGVNFRTPSQGEAGTRLRCQPELKNFSILVQRQWEVFSVEGLLLVLFSWRKQKESELGRQPDYFLLDGLL